MRIKPLNTNVLVQLVEIDNKTSGGILLTSPVTVDVLQGNVLAVGSLVTDITLGNIAAFSKSDAKLVESAGDKCYIVDESKIIYLLEPDIIEA